KLDPYAQLVMEAPPSPDYIPRPEAPPSPDYILGPDYPEYLPPADDVFPAEEQPLPAAVSPTAESPRYIMDSKPEMDPEEENGDDEKSKGDSIYYPTSRGDDDPDDDGDDLLEDDVDDEDEDESSDKPFKEGKTAATPPPSAYRVTTRISVRPHIPMSFPSKSELERLLAGAKGRRSIFGAASGEQEEKQIEEEQATKAQNSKIPVCYDDDDDYNSAITPDEPVDSLSMGGEHLNTILVTESDEFIKSCVENLVPNPSESEDENECDVPVGFTTFSNVLFNADYDFDSGDDQSTFDEDFLKKIYSNLLFDEEINPMKIDQHPFIAESDLIESMPNHDSSITISSKMILFSMSSPRLLYDNSSPRPPKEIVSDNSNADIESFSPSPIPNKDSDSHIEEIDLPFTLDDPMLPGIEDDDYDSGRDIPILKELLDNYSLSLLDN
nr:hypothetical protein [Tanacetum cinerariifolium]